VTEEPEIEFVWPFDEDQSQYLAAGLDAVFAMVSAHAVALHGPLSQFHYDERDPETGKFLTPADGRVDICDGERALGGALSRFFEAHWRLREQASAGFEVYLASLVSAALRYGWAVADLRHDVPGLMDRKGLHGIEDFSLEIQR
jgi:hypothetical protein